MPKEHRGPEYLDEPEGSEEERLRQEFEEGKKDFRHAQRAVETIFDGILPDFVKLKEKELEKIERPKEPGERIQDPDFPESRRCSIEATNRLGLFSKEMIILNTENQRFVLKRVLRSETTNAEWLLTVYTKEQKAEEQTGRWTKDPQSRLMVLVEGETEEPILKKGGRADLIDPKKDLGKKDRELSTPVIKDIEAVELPQEYQEIFSKAQMKSWAVSYLSRFSELSNKPPQEIEGNKRLKSLITRHRWWETKENPEEALKAELQHIFRRILQIERSMAFHEALEEEVRI